MARPSTEDPWEELRRLHLPPGQFAVFGSGPMGIRGLRHIQDVDIIVRPELWQKLAAQYPVQDHEHGLKRIQIGNIEILNGWYPDVGPIEELVDESEIIADIPFVRLHSVLQWKRLRGQPKDINDIELIEEYFKRGGT